MALRVGIDKEGVRFCPGCGCVLNPHRSHKHLGAFFAFLKFVFDSWPETYTDFQPDSAEHLRAFLLVRAGHRAPKHVFRFASKRELQIVQGFVSEEMRVDRARGVYGWPVIEEGGLVIERPASIAFEKLSEKAFCRITEDVFRVIYEITGIDFDAWKEAGPSPKRRAA